MDPDSKDNARLEELESLQAIYGEDGFTVYGSSSISLNAAGADGQAFQILADIPRDYPGSAKPTFKLKPPLPQDKEEELQREIAEVLATDDVCLYQAIENIRDFLGKLETHGSGDADIRRQEGQNRVAVEAKVEIVHGGVFTVQKSKFQAHVAAVQSVAEVYGVMSALLADRKIAQATHNIMAYRIKIGDTIASDNDDDGEARASGGLAQLLRSIKAENTVVVVTRWFGGTLLGSKRFKIINNVARELLVKAGHASNETSLKE